MATSRVGGKNGAITFITGHAADFASWGLRVTHPVDDDTSYTDTVLGSSHAGSGTVDYNLSAAGFLSKGAASTSPGLSAVTTAGGTVTVTADTGCTYGGTFILTSASIDHRKRAGAIPVSYEAVGDGAITETWATT